MNNKEITINLKNSDNDEIFSFLDIIYDETINIEDIYERNDQIHRLRDILSNLSEKEYEIISLRFGFDNNEPHTLDELSKKYNFSRQYANVTIRKILNKIKTELVGIEIKEKML